MQRFAEHEAAGRQCVLLYCGDHDPGGLHISDSFRKNLEDMSGAVGWHPNNLIIERFGLNYQFIEDNGLSWIDNLETSSGSQLNDTEHKDHYKEYVQEYIALYGVRKCEANALVIKPEKGRELCRDTILKYLPATAPQAFEERLKPHREALEKALNERFSLSSKGQSIQ